MLSAGAIFAATSSAFCRSLRRDHGSGPAATGKVIPACFAGALSRFLCGASAKDGEMVKTVRKKESPDVPGDLKKSASGIAPRPNVVVFMTDDQSQLDLEPYGAVGIHTPNMQRVADAGMRFSDAYVVSPTCAPSRAALLTGLMPARNGAEANHGHARPDIKKWPAYFQELGYEVVAFGKVAHYGQAPEYGFDYFAHDTFHDHASVPAAVEYLHKRRGTTTKPLCFLFGSNWPHVPWPEEIGGIDQEALVLPAGSVDTPETRIARAQYAAGVGKADDDLGAIYDAVNETLGDNTIFVFSSDNGAQWPFAKWNCYEAGIRVPLVVEWPGVVETGTENGAIISWIDLLPTLLESVGGKAPGNIDGRSFLGILRGKTAEHRDRLYATHTGDGDWNIYPIRSLRVGNWKYVMNLHPEFAFTTHFDLPGKLCQRHVWETWVEKARTDPDAAAIVKRYHERMADELYDLSVDPYEQNNLAGDPAQAERLQQMKKELHEWLVEQKDRFLLPGEPRLLSDPTSYGPKAVGGDLRRARQAG
jgi:N-sulfoglucosamine sulfohydrolase